ncbi:MULTISPECIES: hypothetical protein [unclassified Burkholderia]|nr:MULTISPECIES: hypothetical protein [unclassified Burkholderia]
MSHSGAGSTQGTPGGIGSITDDARFSREIDKWLNLEGASRSGVDLL